MGLLNIALNIHVIIIIMNVLLRKQQKMRENGRNWDKKLNVDINKDNSKTVIENFGKFAISDCCFICLFVCLCVCLCLSRCLSGRFNYEGLVPHKQYFAGTLLEMPSCASYVSRTHDVIDDVTWSQSRSLVTSLMMSQVDKVGQILKLTYLRQYFS